MEDAEEDEKQLDQFPMVNAPFFADYGTEIRLGSSLLLLSCWLKLKECFGVKGENVYINFNMIILDTCLVTIGKFPLPLRKQILVIRQ